MSAIGPNLAIDTTTAEAGLGDRFEGADGKCYVYVQASSAVAANDVVGISEAYAAAPLTKAMADDGWKIGVAQVAIASGSYLPVQVKGVCSANVLANCAADAALYTSATAGSLDDDNTSQTKITGIVLTTANGGSPAAAAAFMAVEPRSAGF